MDVKQKRAWVTLGLNTETKHVVIAGFSDSPRAAKRKARERMNNDEYPYDAARFFEITDHLGPAIDTWLKEMHGVGPLSRKDIIQQIGREILAMMEN